MKKMTSPHDKFFKTAMSDLRVAKDFLEAHLPIEIKTAVDLNTLSICQDKYVDPQLQLLLTDIVYSVQRLDQSGLMYVLVEHQSTPDRFMSFRLLKYTVQIMTQSMKETDVQSLPMVYALVFYNGTVPYFYSTDIFDLFDEGADLARKFLFKPFKLVDVTKIPDTMLNEHAWASVLELCMKHVPKADMTVFLKKILSLMQSLDNQGGEDYIDAALNYCIAAGEVSDKLTVLDMIKSAFFTNDRRDAMTLADHFRAEGRQEGHQAGRQEVIIEFLKRGLDLNFVSQATNISMTELQALQQLISPQPLAENHK